MRLARGFGPFGAGGYDPPLHREDFGLPRGWIDGLVLANNGTDATNDIDIAAGVCRSTSNIGPDGVRTTLARHQRDIELAATLVKQLDVTWAPGNNGGRSSSSISDTTWHVYAIGGRGLPDDILLHDGVDPSAVLPAGYTAWRRIGSTIRASAALLSFRQVGDRFSLNSPVLDVNNQSIGTSAVLFTLGSVPAGIVTRALLNVVLNQNSTSTALYVSCPTDTDMSVAGVGTFTAPLSQIGFTNGASGSPAAPIPAQLEVDTDTSRRVRARASSASNTMSIATCGWLDLRGRNS